MSEYIESNDLTLDADDAWLASADAPGGVQPSDADASGTDGAPATPQAGQPGGEPPETPDGAKTSDDWKVALQEATDPLDLLNRLARNVSREDIVRDPTLAGIIGDVSDKLERKRAAERQHEATEAATAAARAERERKLEEATDAEDVLTLGELALEERRAAREQKQLDTDAARGTEAAQQQFAHTAKQTLDRFVDAQEPEVKAAIAALATQEGRYNEPTWEANYTRWLADVQDIKLQHARGAWEKGTREAVRSEERGALESAEPEATPMIGGRSESSTSDLISQAVWVQNRGDASWRRQNLERIMRSVAAGLIQD